MSSSDSPEREQRERRSLLRRLALWLGIPIVALLALLVLGIPIPLAILQRPIEMAASEALGLEVRARDLGLVLGVRPALAIDDLRIAHAVEGRPDLLRAERIELEVGLPALLERRLRVRHASVENVTVRTDPEALPEPRETTPQEEPAPAGAGLAGWSMDVDRLAVTNVEVEVHRPDVAPTRARLDELSGRLIWNDSLELSLSGLYEDLPLAARLEGGPVGELLAGATGWPLRLGVDLAGNPVAFEARLATAEGVYRIDDMEGLADETRLTGWLALENLATKPRASGSIQLDSIALEIREQPEDEEPRPEPAESAAQNPVLMGLLTGQPAPQTEGPGPIAATMAVLEDFETDLALGIARMSGLGPTIEDLSLALRVEGGELLFPVSLTVDGIPMTGTLGLDRREDAPHLAFRLRADDFRVDTLAAKLAPEANIEGGFKELSLELEGSGNSARSFLETLRMKLRADDAELSYGLERRVPFFVDELALELEERGPLSLQLRGDLLGETVALDLAGGSVEDLITETPWALGIEATGAGATASLEGEAVGFLANAQLVGDLHVHGERLSSLEPWLGELPIPDAPYRVRMKIDDLPDLTRVTLEEVSLGETKLTGEIGERREGEAPLAWATLRIGSVDLSRYLDAAKSKRPRVEAADEEQGSIGIDAPILPGGVKIIDADLDIAVGRLLVGDLELANLGFRGSFRDGHLPESSFGLGLGGARFEGTAAIDLREPPHGATFTLGSRDVDVGRLLSRLDVARGIDARARSLRIEAVGEGATLADVLRSSDVTARLEGVQWRIVDPNSGGALRLRLQRAELRSPRGEPVRLVAEGTLDRTPVKLRMQTVQLSFLDRPEERIPLDLELEMAGATLEVRSTAALPIERADLALELVLSGRSLADASTLFEYELPAIGPYRLASRLRLTRKDYRIEDFDLRVGQSRLRGRGSLDTRGVRPRVRLDLASERVQLDDFAAAWQGDDEEGAPVALSAEDAPTQFTSPEGLAGFDGRLDVRVDRVLSGQDELGKGTLTATLENGRLEVDPLHIELPGGPFDLRLGYGYRGDRIAARVRANTEKFDYGVLARRVDPETEMSGWLSLDLDIEGEAEDQRRLLAASSGHLDFLAAPEHFATDVFDLWAVSLLTFILPRLDAGPRSELNCVVARFDLDDGIMEERALLLDTTGMVVRGDATVDFRKERVRARLTPAPKKAAFLSLQTAVEVQGGFEDFGVSVPPEELVGTLLRFVTSVVIVPLQRIIGGSLPADGEETCRAAWQEPRPQ
ncbi:MAG: AsmA-like C-terminal region-containing protein [Myxococcota bacterium]|nr:AsmA-like C-terminal region-containing protein [Myxococcota bacterium]